MNDRPTPPPPPPVPAPAPPPSSSNGRVLGCLAILGLLVLLGSLTINLVLFAALVADADSASMAGGSNRPYQEILVDGESALKKGDDRIIQLEITGVISNFSESELSPSMVETFRRQVKQALKDDKVKALLVRINSPGGEVLASDILYHEIKKAAAKKPVLVFMESVAASGGFYAAMGAENIMANELTLTGSIGVIVQTLTYQELGEKVGVDFYTYTSGPNKAMFGGPKPITPEQADLIRGIVGESYNRFLSIVAESRDLEANALKATLADGRVLTGQQALDGKLIDELGYLDDAFAKIRDLAKAPGAKIVRYRRELNIFEVFSALGQAQATSPEIKVNLLPDVPRLQSGIPYYLAPYIFQSP